MGTWLVRAEDVVGEQRTDPSLAWLVPKQGFWADDEVSETPCFSPYCLAINKSQANPVMQPHHPGSGGDPKEELHCDEPLRILQGLRRTKLCNDG